MRARNAAGAHLRLSGVPRFRCITVLSRTIGMTSPVGTLYVEELKATMRGRFAWLGAAVMLTPA